MKRKLSTSGVDPGAARRPGQNRRSVLEQLDAPVERPAVDHVESDIGIAVVDPLPAAASGDDGKDNHAEAVHEAGLQQRPAQGEAANGAHRLGALGLHLPHGFNGVFSNELRVRPGKGSLKVVEKTTVDMPVRDAVPCSPSAANPDMTR